MFPLICHSKSEAMVKKWIEKLQNDYFKLLMEERKNCKIEDLKSLNEKRFRFFINQKGRLNRLPIETQNLKILKILSHLDADLNQFTNEGKTIMQNAEQNI
jgi:hypothetical protein